MMRIKIKQLNALTSVLVILTLNACIGANTRPIVDPKGVNMVNFDVDLVECQQIAKQKSIAEEAGKGAMIGAAGGALIGTVTGAVFGNPGQGAAAGTGYGGTSGAVHGATSGLYDQESIVKKCMAGRGYRVLN